MKNCRFRRVIALLIALVLCTAPIGVNAENALMEEDTISEGLSSVREGAVDEGAITPDRFFWPNEYGQYSYSYQGAQDGRKYMLLSLPGVYKSLDVMSRDELVANLTYLDQDTAKDGVASFDGFIPAVEQNSTIIVGGEGMDPVIVGYISKNIFRFGMYSQDERGEEPLTDSYVVRKGTSWDELAAMLPTSGYMEIRSDYIGSMMCPVSFAWQQGESFKTSKAGYCFICEADVSMAGDAQYAWYSELAQPFSITVAVQDEASVPVELTVMKRKVTYRKGDVLGDEDIKAKVIYSDGLVREVTGYTTNIASISSDLAGIYNIKVTYSENGVTVEAEIPIRILDSDEESKTFQVDFETFGGSYVPARFVNEGDRLSMPDDPVKNGFVFSGWYSDRDITKIYDTDVPVTQNMTLYARWRSAGSPILDSISLRLDIQNFRVGETLTRDMIHVTAFYSDGSKAEVDSFSDNLASIDQTKPGTKMLKVRYADGNAVYEAEENFRIIARSGQSFCSVTFITGFELEIKEQTVMAGDKIKMPDALMEREGYVFVGWYYNSKKWDFENDTVTENIELTAKWIRRYEGQDGLYGFLDDVEGYEYTGKAIKPDIVVMDKNLHMLHPGKDYTVKYKNNVRPSEEGSPAMATITGKGNYGGTIDMSFSILKKDITDMNGITASLDSVKAYKKSGYIPVPKLKHGKKTMKNKSDFTVSYERLNSYDSPSGTAAGEKLTETGYYSIVITGQGNYTGVRRIGFEIAGEGKKSLAKASAKLDKNAKNIQYTGNPVNISGLLTVSFGKKEMLTEGVDYSIIYPDDNISVGKKKLTVKALPGSSKCFGQKTVVYNISGIQMKAVKVNFEKTKTAYTGSLIQDNVHDITVSLNKEQANMLNTYYGTSMSPKDTYTLVEDKDYFIEYRNNENAGKAKVRVTGMGLFSGTVDKMFSIQPVSLSDSAMSVNLAKDSVVQQKSGAEVSVKAVYNVDDHDITLKKNKDYKLTYKKNTDAGTASVIVTGVGNYKGKVTKQFTIIPKSLTSKNIKVEVTNPLAADKGSSYLYKPIIRIYDNGTVLGKGDYDIDYAGSVTQADLDAGRTFGYVIIKAKGTSYTAQRAASYKVAKASLKSKECTASIADQEYSGDAIVFDLDDARDAAAFTVKIGSEVLVPGEDFKVTGYKNNIVCGNKAEVTIEGTGNYTGTRKVKFKILKENLSM